MKLNDIQKRFLAGVGSVFAIMPSTSYADFTPSHDAKERMDSYWQDTGKHLRVALNNYEQKQTHRKQKQPTTTTTTTK